MKQEREKLLEKFQRYFEESQQGSFTFFDASSPAWVFASSEDEVPARRLLQFLKRKYSLEKAALWCCFPWKEKWFFSGKWSRSEKLSIQKGDYFLSFERKIQGKEGRISLFSSAPLEEELVEPLLIALWERWHCVYATCKVADLEKRLTEQTTSLQHLEQLWQRFQEPQALGRFGLVGKCPAMQEVYQWIERVKDLDLPVLIQGESGTGKELVARAIHYAGNRRNFPFVGENCAAIPSSLLESTFFGYEKGAFSGALKAYPGLFRQSGQGTLFLDEIGELPLPLQAKLLRALEEKKVRPLGGKRQYSWKSRVIAATNRSLLELVRKKKFRQDLYYRLAKVVISLPPLRERGEDILLLAEHFIKRYEEEFGFSLRWGKGMRDYFMRYPWPGNVRELENEILRLFALGRRKITLSHMSPTFQRYFSTKKSYKKVLEEQEREIILSTLLECQWNKSRAAKALGIDRSTLYFKIQKYGLEP